DLVTGVQTCALPIFGTQAGNIVASRVADIEVLIRGHVTSKRTVRRYIQPVTGRPGYTRPVGSETAGSLVGRLQCSGSSGRLSWCRRWCRCFCSCWCCCMLVCVCVCLLRCVSSTRATGVV